MDIRQHKPERPDGLGVWRARIECLTNGGCQLLNRISLVEQLSHLLSFALRGPVFTAVLALDEFSQNKKHQLLFLFFFFSFFYR